jgi:sodium-dependent dicarboxylate transporter 2/3/5
MSESRFPWPKKIGFPLGIIIFIAVLLAPVPAGLSAEAKRAGAVVILMAVWWLTETLPMAVTALVPLVLFPLLSVMDAGQTSRFYADPTIFLFIGGFMIAMAMQKWGLHKRLALYVISNVGARPRALLAGFCMATAFISMWVSNTATAVMMLPIAMAVTSQIGSDENAQTNRRFAQALMLGIAYSCSIGGVATLIGSPPNMIFAGQSKALFPELGEVGFVRWFLFSFPLALGFLFIVWIYLAFIVLGKTGGAFAGSKEAIDRQIRSLGPWSKGEIGVMTVFLLTAVAWIWKADLKMGDWVIPGWSALLSLKGVHDGTIAIIAALVLFAAPVSLKKGEFLLDWESAVKLPWGVVLLFGGGFALAESFRVTGLDAWLGSGLEIFKGVPPVYLVFGICLATTFFSELMSNTAQVTMLIPVLAAASGVLGVHPYFLMIPATIAASFSFMMPVGTPPNAVVFGSGYLTISKMAKTGVVLNLLGAVWITLITFFLLEPVFGLSKN